MAIPQSFIQELLARADVVEIVGRFVPLKKGGANFTGLCPFHSEKSPSFSVSPTKQFFHCFGCGKSGDAIRFLMDHAGMSFFEAVTDLAQQYGMVVPEDDASPEDRARAKEQKERQNTLTSVLEKAAEAYRKHLKDSARAIQYFKGRGLSGEIARQFGLGYAPEGWRSLASVFPHYDDPLLVESGLVISSTDEGDTEEKRYDRFRDRVMFPIRNIKGECIGFGGRVLGDEKPKYLNSPETPVFSKGRELYGLFEARNHLRNFGYVLVTEGYMDVVALAQLGFPNAVATLGTACTNEHVQKMFRFTDAVVFSFDGDAAGRRAARKALDGALPFATDVRSIKFLFLPPEHDPDSFIRAHGAEAFAKYVADATPLSRFLLESAREGLDLHSAEGRAHFSSNAKPLWSLLPAGALKIQLLGEIADLVHVDSRELSKLWGADPKPFTNRNANASGQTGTRSAGPAAGRPRLPGRGQPVSRADHAARMLLRDGALWEALTNEDHALLCSLPPPHGDLMVWLESQLHELGPLPWADLRPHLAQHPLEASALHLMNEHATQAAESGASREELAAELRDLINRMLIDHIKTQENAAAQAIGSTPGDAEALARYRALIERRKQLQGQLEKTQTDGII